MGTRRFMEKAKGIEILFVIVPPVCVLCTTETGQNIKGIIILGFYLILVEVVTKSIDPKRDSIAEDQIILTILKVLSFFMIYMTLTGDRILSFLSFVILVGLLYVIIMRNRIPPQISTEP